MADASPIEWTDSTFNPWIGCTNVSPGCDHCYAETLATRYGWVKWGAGRPRQRTSEANWRKPIQWNKHVFVECMNCRWRGESRDARVVNNPSGFHPPVKMARGCPRCLSFSLKEARRRVFCASLADVFDTEVDPAWREDLFRLIWQTPNLDWLLLTKRIGNVSRMLASMGMTESLPWPNIWLGATVVNQEEADRDIPKLLGVPARVRFLSVEPMLGPVDLAMHLGAAPAHEDLRGLLHWVIAGGESGHHARPMHPDWARSLRDQCQAAGVPFFMKQMGGARDKRGALEDLPPDLRIREFPRAA